MANIKKSFNFRNGVQVDEDNLLVTSTGLVAIGKTVPTEALDVIGNVIISGVTSSVFTQTGVLTVTTVNPTEIIGAGVSVVSGVVTSNSGSGIVTYYGDARFLQGMPTSQWQDTNAGFGVSSIYNTGGTVGIATTNPQSTLQVGNDPFSSGIGVGIASAGNIRASGTITASSLVGAVTGNVTGDVTGDITGNVTGDLTGNSTGNLTGLVNSAGISTFAGINATGRIVGAAVSNVIPFFYSNFSDLPSPVTYHGAFAHVHSTGRGYYAHGGAWIELVNKDTSGNLSLSGDLDVDGHTNLDNVSISGVSTFSENIDFVGNPAGIAQTSIQFHKGDGTNSNLDALNFYDNAAINVGKGHTGGFQMRGNFNSTGASPTFNSYIFARGDNFFIDGGNSTSMRIRTQFARDAIVANSDNGGSGTVELYHSSGGTATKKLETSGVGVTITNQLDTTNIVASGVITATTELNSPLIGVGTDAPVNPIQVRGTGNTEIQVTSDTGTAGITVGREPGVSNTNNAEFRYGLVSSGSPYSSAQSLDIINHGLDNFNYVLSGNNPAGATGDFHWLKGFNSTRLMTLTKGGNLGIGETQPQERLTVAGVCTVTSNSFVGGNFDVSGNAIIGGNLTLGGSLNISAITSDLTGNVTGNLTGNVNATIGISSFRKIGINTTVNNIGSADLDCLNANAVFKRVGIGSTEPDAILDVSGDLSQPSKRFIMLPKVSAGSTAVIQSDSAEGGGLIYNTTLRKLQFFNGTNWETVTSVEVFG